MINANPGLRIPQMAVYHKKYHVTSIIYYHDLEATSISHKPLYNGLIRGLTLTIGMILFQLVLPDNHHASWVFMGFTRVFDHDIYGIYANLWVFPWFFAISAALPGPGAPAIAGCVPSPPGAAAAGRCATSAAAAPRRPRWPRQELARPTENQNFKDGYYVCIYTHTDIYIYNTSIYIIYYIYNVYVCIYIYICVCVCVIYKYIIEWIEIYYTYRYNIHVSKNGQRYDIPIIIDPAWSCIISVTYWDTCAFLSLSEKVELDGQFPGLSWGTVINIKMNEEKQN